MHHDLSKTYRNSGSDKACLQFNMTLRPRIVRAKIISQKWTENKAIDKVFHYKKINCSIFGHKFSVKTFFIMAEMPSQSVQRD